MSAADADDLAPAQAEVPARAPVSYLAQRRGQRAPFVVELARFVLVALGYLSLVPALAWYLAYLQLGDDHWWMFVLNSGATYLFAPVPLVLVAALATRRWALAGFALLPVLVAGLVFGQALVPRALKVAAAPPDAPSLSVMTLNLHAHHDDPRAAAAAIRAAGADVLAVQELTPEMAEALAAQLEDLYPYSEIPGNLRTAGQGVFSRYPLEELGREYGWHGQRNPFAVVLHLPWSDAVLVNNHNLSTSRALGEWPSEIETSMRQRERVSESLVALADASPLPVIVVGDFNTPERSTAYAIMTERFADAWPRAGFLFGHSFPGGPLAPTPFGVRPPNWLLRIYYVFYTPELAAVDARIGPWDGVSDHRPVLATLVWQ